MSLSTLQKLFHPSKHLWFRLGNSSRNVIEIGLTDRGLDDVGDVTDVVQAPARSLIETGDELLHIEWEGSKISSADELYHTVWDTFSGTTRILAPFGGELEVSVPVLAGVGIDDDTVLARLRPAASDWTKLQKELLRESDYHRHIQRLSPGLFADHAEDS